MSETRDSWSKAEIIFTAIGAVVLPIALFVVGHSLTTQQETAADAARKQQEAAAQSAREAERLTGLLQPLASENERERRLAIEVAGYLAKTNQLPLELYPVLVSIVRSEGQSSGIAQEASRVLASVEEKNPELRTQIQADLKDLQARVYFHISKEPQRKAAEQLAANLANQEMDLVVPGIERVQGPDISEIRFFKKADQDEANRIARAFQGLGVAVRVRDLTSRYETSERIRPRHFELWLGNDFPKPGA